MIAQALKLILALAVSLLIVFRKETSINGNAMDFELTTVVVFFFLGVLPTGKIQKILLQPE